MNKQIIFEFEKEEVIEAIKRRCSLENSLEDLKNE